MFYNLSITSLTELPVLCTFLVLSGFWVTLCILFKVNWFGIIPERFGDFVEAFANNGVFYMESILGLLCFIANVVLHL